MRYQLPALILFGIGPLGTAYADLVGLGVVGIFHLTVIIVFGIVMILLRRGDELKKALKYKPIWISSLIYTFSSALGLVVMVVVPLPTFAMFIQLTAFTGLILAPLWGVYPNKFDWLALPVALIGGILVVNGSLSSVSVIGWILMTVYIFAAAVSIHYFAGVASKEEISAPAAVWSISLVGAPLVLFQPSLLHADPLALLAIAGTGLAYALGNLLLFISIRTSPAHRFMLLTGVAALTTTVLSVLLLNDPWSLLVVLGGAVVFLAIIILFFAEKRSEKEKQETTEPV